MDFATIGGFIVAFGMVVFGAVLEHVTLKSMLGESAFLICIGGSIGATILSHRMDELKQLPAAFKIALFPPKLDYDGMMADLTTLAEKARRNGLLSLQDDAANTTNVFVQRGLTMAVDGSTPEDVQDVLEAISQADSQEIRSGAAVLDTAGGYAPTLGILGTVMGLVTIMGNLSEPDTLGPAIAVAFLATLYGVGFANLLFIPLGAKVKAAVKQQEHFNDMIITGIVGLQSGENPRNLRERLSVYNRHSNKGKGKAPQEGA